MNILFTVCGRAGSKGFKNKNCKAFLGIPLVYYSLAAVMECIRQLSENINYHVVLNTDSEELVKSVEKQNAIKVGILWRDDILGGDTVPKVEVVKDCYMRCKDLYNIEYDMVVDLDITSPLRTAKDVMNAIKRKRERADTDVVYSVTNARRNPYFNMVKEEGGFYVKAVSSKYTSRQQAPVFYDMNASIYVYEPKALLEKDPAIFFNEGASAIMMKDTAVLDIDSEEDYELMEVVGEYLYSNFAEFAEIKNTAKKILDFCDAV